MATQNFSTLFPQSLKSTNNLSDVTNPSTAAGAIGALQITGALVELGSMGTNVQAMARQNIGTLSRGRALALAIAN